MSLGPFDISPERIEALGIGFTEFINQLLALEVRAQGLAGHTLAVNKKETTPDGGVDAGLRDATGGDWLPTGDSAWQFKRTNLGPQACANELASARWAHEYLRRGGSYVVVLGAALTDNLIERRRSKLVEKAVELNLFTPEDEGRIRVYDANRLARWASHYPALAVSRLGGGPGSVAVDYTSWAASRSHSKHWVADEARAQAIAAIREQIGSDGIVEVRIQGDSGIGKTRLALEALSAEDVRPLVAYVHDERLVDAGLLNHLVSNDRIAILVVDECVAERHAKLAEQLPDDPAIKLVTIGEKGGAAVRSPVIEVGAMPPDAVENFLRETYPQMRPEASRFVSDHCRGNMRWAIVLADRVAGLADAQAADIISRDDIESFVATILPEGRDFFCCAILALLDRVGWDREKRQQLELLAGFADRSVEEMEAAGHALVREGLLVQQGRYRSIAPQPLAVYLAAEAWRQRAGAIVTELLPKLDAEMALSLFRRVADLGRFEPAQSVLPALLADDGPFASLDKIEAGSLGSLLTQLAIVLPDEVALHLSELIEAQPLDALRGQSRSRRDLVWTLEKLAWHKRTFEVSADSLLRLAEAENETWANNSAGTWVELFGLWLPGTAATPRQRIDYLAAVAGRDPSPALRLLLVRAAARGLEQHESIGVSGELQGGVLVEPRGRPETWDEVRDYRLALISLLDQLRQDEHAEVAESAEEQLLHVVQPLIADPLVGEKLADVLAEFQGTALQGLRRRVADLLALYSRHDGGDTEKKGALEGLLRRLPGPTAREELSLLVQQRRWNFRDDELQNRMNEAVARVTSQEDREATLSLLRTGMAAAFELGRALARTHPGEATEQALVEHLNANGGALVGYLVEKVDGGDAEAFDTFLDSSLGRQLPRQGRLAVAVRGPVSERARARILEDLRMLPVSAASSGVFGWEQNLTSDEAGALLDDWLQRIESQEDYDALLDWITMQIRDDQASMPPWIQERSLAIVKLRSRFPADRNEAWAWSRLALRLVRDHGDELAKVILDLAETDNGYMLHRDSYDSEVLLAAARNHPAEVWDDVAGRLEAGSWRVQLSLQGWFLHAVPAEIVETWVGDDGERARLVASIAPVGASEPTPYAVFLLTKFGDDRRVAGNLSGQFRSGTWMGNHSDWLASQIAQLTNWRRRTSLPLRVRNWAAQMIQYLEQERAAALESEAEEQF